MSLILDPFTDNNAFNMASLTASINILPNMYGRIKELKLMPYKGVTTRTILVEEKNGVLNLLPTLPPGSPGTQGKSAKRTARSFIVPHIPHEDSVLPGAWEGVRKFGESQVLSAVVQIVNDKLQEMKDKHAITLEHLRMGALKGVILDADGSTIYNLFTEFGITKKTVDFVLGTDGTNVPQKCRQVLRHIEDNLKGEVKTGVRAFVDESFFDKFIAHSKVKEAFQYHEAAQKVIGGDVREGFKFGGIIWEENRGTATDAAGTARKFIATDYGIAFPEGTRQTFRTLFAPADFNETANTIGLEYYARQEARRFGRGVDLHTQSNPLPICYRPGVLVEVKTSN